MCQSRTSLEIFEEHKMGGFDALHGTVSVCFGMRSKKPSPRANETKIHDKTYSTLARKKA